MAVYNKHRPILVPTCNECNSMASDTMQSDIYERVELVKKKLLRKYGKYIRLGGLWEEGDADYYEFTGNMRTMVETIPRMSKLCSDRINFQHWNVSVDGVSIESESDFEIVIDNKKFKTLNHLYEYTRKVLNIQDNYLDNVLDIVGVRRLVFAVNFCRANPIKSKSDMMKKLDDLKLEEV